MSPPPHSKFSFFRMDQKALLADQKVLHKLANLYCETWLNDENFGEYMVCPVCNKYYSKKDVAVMTKPTCHGTTEPHPETDLNIAWTPDNVIEEEIFGNMEKYQDKFYGVYVVENSSKKVVGFSWGWIEPKNMILQKWKAPILEVLNFSDATYYSEIGVDPHYRGHKLGNKLAKMVIDWMQQTAPNIPAFLRTHRNSFALKVFTTAGYEYFAEDPQHGDGRVMLKVDYCRDLKPEKLNID